MNFYKISYNVIENDDIIIQDGNQFVKRDHTPYKFSIHNVIESNLWEQIQQLKIQFERLNQKFKIEIELDRVDEN